MINAKEKFAILALSEGLDELDGVGLSCATSGVPELVPVATLVGSSFGASPTNIACISFVVPSSESGEDGLPEGGSDMVTLSR